jgi:hypothetical protein
VPQIDVHVLGVYRVCSRRKVTVNLRELERDREEKAEARRMQKADQRRKIFHPREHYLTNLREVRRQEEEAEKEARWREKVARRQEERRAREAAEARRMREEEARVRRVMEEEAEAKRQAEEDERCKKIIREEMARVDIFGDDEEQVIDAVMRATALGEMATRLFRKIRDTADPELKTGQSTDSSCLPLTDAFFIGLTVAACDGVVAALAEYHGRELWGVRRDLEVSYRLDKKEKARLKKEREAAEKARAAKAAEDKGAGGEGLEAKEKKETEAMVV